jgi:hypothetical protein
MPLKLAFHVAHRIRERRNPRFLSGRLVQQRCLARLPLGELLAKFLVIRLERLNLRGGYIQELLLLLKQPPQAIYVCRLQFEFVAKLFTLEVGL